MNQVNPRAKRVLELIQAGKPEEAGRYIIEETGRRLHAARLEMMEAEKEREQLMAMVALFGISVRDVPPDARTMADRMRLMEARRAAEYARRGSVPPPVHIEEHNSVRRIVAVEERSPTIKKYAIEAAKKRPNQQIKVQDVVNELAAHGLELGIKVPNTAVGNVLNRSGEWKRIGKGVFRYQGGTA